MLNSALKEKENYEMVQQNGTHYKFCFCDLHKKRLGRLKKTREEGKREREEKPLHSHRLFLFL